MRSSSSAPIAPTARRSTPSSGGPENVPKPPPNSSNCPLIGPRLGHESKNRRFHARSTKNKSAAESGALQGLLQWRDPDSNRGHHDFQSCALPTELSRRDGLIRVPRASVPAVLRRRAPLLLAALALVAAAAAVV